MDLKGKTILLTGATGGIGEAIARQLTECGSRLILVGRSDKNLKYMARELRLARNNGFTLQADIATHAGRETIRTALIALENPIDVLINCAGVSLFGFLEDNQPADIEKMINTNVTATILLTQQVLPFLNKDQGRILIVGSSFGALGFPGFAAYCASKFALRGFAEALRRELADSKMQVAHIAPRATNTRLNSDAVVELNDALGNNVDEPEDVALAVENLLSMRNIHDVNLGWPERLFLRINAVFPRLIDKALRGKLPLIRSFVRKERDVNTKHVTINPV
ncbi:MAG: SDR family oxidoreductase [Cellvibrio sp.]|uniref:SDR family oxidoreductase n=1 Tax=Cellvibrio sp. TaxID=1965322 RepID=UPI0031B382DF